MELGNDKTFCPFNLEEFAKDVAKCYNQTTEKELIVQETYACSVYVKPTIERRSDTVSVFIKHNDVPGASYIPNMVVPREKHLSIYRVELRHKQVKCEQEVRRFKKANSVFAKWKEDTPQLLAKCYESDMKLTKLNRFIKDEVDRAKTFEVLKKYYTQLKN